MLISWNIRNSGVQCSGPKTDMYDAYKVKCVSLIENLICLMLLSHFAYYFTLKMEAIYSSELSGALELNGIKTNNKIITNKTNSVAWVWERTIPTGRPPIVGEVSNNFSG
jgi:hypothetical protein